MQNDDSLLDPDYFIPASTDDDEPQISSDSSLSFGIILKVGIVSLVDL